MNFRKMLREQIIEAKKEDNLIEEKLALHIVTDGLPDIWDILYILYDPRQLIETISNKSSLKIWYQNYSKQNAASYYDIGLIGAMALRKHRKDCGDSWETKGSGIIKKYQGRGYGKMLYGLIMAEIYPNFLMADRGSVTDKAQNVWKGMEKNSKMETFPPDFWPFMGKFDNVDSPKTEPYEDDCDIYKGKSFLNKAYRPESSNKRLLNQLKKNSRLCVAQIEPSLLAKIEDTMTYLFGFIYNG